MGWGEMIAEVEIVVVSFGESLITLTVCGGSIADIQNFISDFILHPKSFTKNLIYEL